FVLISGHANAAGPFMSCLYMCNVNIVWAGLIQGSQRYIFYFNFLRNNANCYNALHWGEVIKNFSDNYKLTALMAKDCYYLIFFRDPISVFASCFGYDLHKVKNERVVLPTTDDFNLGGYIFNKKNIFSSNIDCIFNNVLPNCFCQKDILDYFSRKLKTIIIDSDATSRANAFFTITKLSKILNFSSPKTEDKFFFESKLSPFSSPIWQRLPLRIQFKEFNIEIEFGSGWMDTKELSSNIFKKVFYLDGIVLNISIINKTNQLLNQYEINHMKDLFNNFLENVELEIKNIKKDKVIEVDVLKLLKTNLNYRNRLNSIIKNNLSY
ncbi:DUF2972 domain-containing protein, partial [Campylobacter sp. 2457A]|uniref:DUF2972 domain-containing protein n=1 Tax=Campylobacter sp. 2457A TaxID=2735784 RepID=UPI00301DB632|nr:DUF2972 domain-containing protein [Campylobacter sp. 2457A]